MTFWQWVVYIFKEYWPLFLRGTAYTMLISLTSTVIGFIIGLIVASVRSIHTGENDSPVRSALVKVIKFILGVYIEIFRGTPMIVQACVIYYGALQYLGIDMPMLTAAIFIVSVNTGAYMAEIIRGGIISVDSGQTEGAYSVGMTHAQAMFYVVLPQAVRNIMPSIGNEFVVNIKDSSVLNVIAVTELFFMAKSAAGTYLRYFEVYAIIAVIYLFLTFTVTRLLRLMEKKMDGSDTYTVMGSQSDSRSVITVHTEEHR